VSIYWFMLHILSLRYCRARIPQNLGINVWASVTVNHDGTKTLSLFGIKFWLCKPQKL